MSSFIEFRGGSLDGVIKVSSETPPRIYHPVMPHATLGEQHSLYTVEVYQRDFVYETGSCIYVFKYMNMAS